VPNSTEIRPMEPVLTQADTDRQETHKRTNSPITISYLDRAFMAIQCSRKQ